MSANNGSYYSHIDALRAIAVFTVILFHINHAYLPGGFVGVDIFFVISGFLISAQLFKSVSNNTFSIKDFYTRRIKRILPAAFSVIFVTVLVAQFLYLPDDASKVAESSIWSAFSLSNVYFWKFQDTGYFASASYTTPLLHYWSLGVEEQFYIFWPIIVLVLLPKLSPKIFIGLLFLTIIISASIAELLLKEHHSFVYYMLPARAGELLVGALLAALLHFNVLKKPQNNQPFFILSIFTIIGSCLLITSNMVFPGFLYLVPTIAAAVFIWAGFNQTSLIYKIVTIKPILWLGKISYSAYLVHWPLLAFYRYGYGEPTLLISIFLLAVILLLAWLNWKHVEEKFRYNSYSFKQLALKQLLLPSMVIVVLASFVIQSNGFGLRIIDDEYATKLIDLENKAVATNRYNYICQYWRLEEQHLNNKDCIIGNDKTSDVLLWGDSNAAHYIGILGTIAKAGNWSFRNASHAACPHIFSDVKNFVKPSRYNDCQQSVDLVKTKLPLYKTVFVSASYDTYSNKDSNFMSYFKDTIIALANDDKRVTIIGKAPVFENYDRHCLAKSLLYLGKDCFKVEQSNKAQIDDINFQLEKLSNTNPNISYIDFNSLICNDKCSPYKNGKPIYFDSSHIEIGASWLLGEKRQERKSNNIIQRANDASI